MIILIFREMQSCTHKKLYNKGDQINPTGKKKLRDAEAHMEEVLLVNDKVSASLR